MLHCNFENCQNPPSFVLRCEEHKRCDRCGSKENLCWYGKVDGLLCNDCRAAQIAERVRTFTGDTQYKSLITCPYCGNTITDSWEYNDDNGEEIECEDCENIFSLEVDVVVTYSTAKLPEK